jgi:hypothetical protein
VKRDSDKKEITSLRGRQKNRMTFLKTELGQYFGTKFLGFHCHLQAVEAEQLRSHDIFVSLHFCSVLFLQVFGLAAFIHKDMDSDLLEK